MGLDGCRLPNSVVSTPCLRSLGKQFSEAAGWMTPTIPSRSSSQALGLTSCTSSVPCAEAAVGLLRTELRKSAGTAMLALH
jgi:hypothetical protein